jgi:hypothetical protein
VTCGSQMVVWWRCSRKHEWQESVGNRTKGSGCPFCSGHRVSIETSLATKAPHLAAQWHPTKNGTLTPWDIVAGSERTVWWKCPAGPDHEWTALPYARFASPGCPFCANKRVSVTNSLATTNPDLAAQWHPNENGTLTPADVVAGSPRRVWWKCPKGPDHEWNTMLHSRLGCPFCANKRVSVTNSLATLFPSLAHQWHPTRNAGLTPDRITAVTGKKIWWRCPFGHQWQQSPRYRTQRNSDCPLCPRRRRRQALTRKAPREKVRLHSDGG